MTTLDEVGVQAAQEVVQWLHQGKELVLSQGPALAAEIVERGILANTIGAIVAGVLGCVAMIAAIWFWLHRDEIEYFFLVPLFVGLALWGGMAAAIYWALAIQCAPRLYIINKMMELIKQ
jgi:hypothetical protein